MTQKEKLIEIGFKDSVFFKSRVFKNFTIGKNTIHIGYYTNAEKGTISNIRAGYHKEIESLEELLRLNDFYEKQSKR